MTRRTSPRTIAALVAGLAAGGAVGFAVGVPSLINAAPSVTQQVDDTGDTSVATDDPEATDETTVGALHHGEPHRDHGGPRGGGRAVEVLTGVLGLDAEALRGEFAAGKSVADVATEQGVAPEAVVDALVDDLAAHLDEHVTDGKLTQEEADTKVAEAETRFTERLDDVPAFGAEGPHESGRGPGRGLSEAVLTLLGVDAEALRAEFEAGRTIADVAAANGVDVQAVIDLMVTEAEAHIAEHVAEGKLTQEEADARLAEVEATVTERVNTVPTPGEGRGGRHGGRDGRHGGPAVGTTGTVESTGA
jgi:lipoate-protein ligase A